MAYHYARVAPDAFSDITDVQLRNQRIQQDLLNQRRNFEAQQAARDFAEWQKAWDRKDYGYYSKDDVARAYGKQTPFVGQAPSISKGLESLGITPEGKLTFGIHGSNLVSPLRNKPRKFRTDNNGNPIPLSDEEIALTEKASAEMNQQAASDAGQGEENREKPWYDFLKYPQNTPYEQEQMRNQGILRDAAIAAAMNKPVFYPEADTLSEPMAKLAGQQSSLAQSAMGQFTQRQGMAADMYKQVTNLANSYAAQSLQAQMAAQKLKANSDESANNAKVYEEQAAALFGQMPKDMQEASKQPNFLEVVRSKHDEKALALAQQYDALKRSQAMLENDALSKNEQANSYLAKAKAFGDGVTNLDRDWNLGLNFNAGGLTPYDVKKNTQPVQFGGQDDIGRNEWGNNAPKGASVSQEDSLNNGYSLGGDYEKQLANFGLKFDPNTGNIYKPKHGGSGKKVVTDPLDSEIKKLKAGRDDVNIANWAAVGSRYNLDTGFQAAKDQNAWLKRLGAAATKVASNPQNLHKYADFAWELVDGRGRFGDAADIIISSRKLNLPMYKGLSDYENDIHTKGYEAGGELGRLSDLYDVAKSGEGLTAQEIKSMEKTLRELFKAKNAQGIEQPLFQNNGFSLKYSKRINPYSGEAAKDENGNELYNLDLTSFK